jgi:hypothetical protein
MDAKFEGRTTATELMTGLSTVAWFDLLNPENVLVKPSLFASFVE